MTALTDEKRILLYFYIGASSAMPQRVHACLHVSVKGQQHASLDNVGTAPQQLSHVKKIVY